MIQSTLIIRRTTTKIGKNFLLEKIFLIGYRLHFANINLKREFQCRTTGGIYQISAEGFFQFLNFRNNEFFNYRKYFCEQRHLVHVNSGQRVMKLKCMVLDGKQDFTISLTYAYS
ncbi:hypothetical protein QE152_g33956 [Popillia japonica]|uniref:Uncharacterized protein n=1 Tax=Popillia japonica TaxID=7064 RepID=A0AAW1IVD0_POPJA